MKVITGLVLAVCALLCAFNAFCLSDDSITVSNDPEAKALEISVRFPTHQPRVDYIRRIEVVINKEPPVIKSFNFQRGPAQKMSVPVEDMKKIETLLIRAYPTNGKSAERMFKKEELQEL